jgi:hypothetical protein
MFGRSKKQQPKKHSGYSELDPEGLLQMGLVFNFLVTGNEGVAIDLKQKIKIYGHYVGNGTLYVNYYNSLNQIASITAQGSTECSYTDNILNLRFPGNQTATNVGFTSFFGEPIVTDRLYVQGAATGIYRFILYYKLIPKISL